MPCHRCQTLEGTKPRRTSLTRSDLWQVFAACAFSNQSGPRPDVDAMESNVTFCYRKDHIKLYYLS